jgi:hypothetical protein
LCWVFWREGFVKYLPPVNRCLCFLSSWDCCGNLKLRYGTLRQLSRKERFIVPADSADACPKAEPREQRDLTVYTLASRLQKQKARSNPYMVIFNSTGYFTLMLCDFPPPQCYLTLSMFRSLRFYLSAMPSLPPCHVIRTQA